MAKKKKKKKSQKQKKIKIVPLRGADAEVFKIAEDIVKKYSKKRSQIPLFIIMIVLIIIILSLLFSTIFAIQNHNKTEIIEGISILGIDFSNRNPEDVKKELREKIEERLNHDIILKHNEEIYTCLPEQLDIKFNIEEIVDAAYLIGRTGNIFQNNFEIFDTKNNKKNLKLKASLDLEKLSLLLDEANEKFEDGIKQPEYLIEGNKLTITKGKRGVVAIPEEMEKLVIEKMELFEYNTDPIIIKTEEKDPYEINIDEIYKEIHKDPVDATFTKNPYKVTASENGVDFAISLDEAKQLVKEDKEKFEIKLKTLYPNISTNDISSEAFPDIIATYDTTFSSSNVNRSTNIKLATARYNGKVLMPGESISFNSTVGKRTPTRGYKEAAVFVNGGTSTDYGGGICQLSSTLYNAALRANLEIVDRSNHAFAVGYVPIGTDATVSWGSPDFVFKNTRSYPIKIEATASDRVLRIKIHGLKEENEYQILIESKKTGSIHYNTTYTTDNSLKKGAEKVIQQGINGSTAITYKIYKKDGVEVKREIINRDRYRPQNKIIARGTR